jgi:probable O-glycosylation ligase (exosortase A-associated)
MGRVVAWKLSFILASDHPLFGGGFRALESYRVWMDLSQQFDSFPWFYTGDAVPDVRRSHAAHSAYFQVMGDQGFAGLILYLSILLTSFTRSRRIQKLALRPGVPPWIKNLNTMVQLSLFSFCVGSAALSFAYFDLSFALIGLLIVIEKRILPGVLAERKE